MPTIIEASSAILGNGTSDSSIDLAAEAGKKCIQESGTNKREISLLINPYLVGGTTQRSIYLHCREEQT